MVYKKVRDYERLNRTVLVQKISPTDTGLEIIDMTIKEQNILGVTASDNEEPLFMYLYCHPDYGFLEEAVFSLLMLPGKTAMALKNKGSDFAKFGWVPAYPHSTAFPRKMIVTENKEDYEARRDFRDPLIKQNIIFN